MRTITSTVSRQNPVAFTPNWGVSKDAATIREAYDGIKQSFARTTNFGERLSRIVEALLKARQEYSEDNWDGYGASRIDGQSFENALRFALSLPFSVPTPDIDVIPAGQVVFVWYEGKRRVFSVIIGSLNELSYAGLYGATKAYGVEYFNDGIPDTILNNIDRVYL